MTRVSGTVRSIEGPQALWYFAAGELSGGELFSKILGLLKVLNTVEVRGLLNTIKVLGLLNTRLLKYGGY